MFQPHLPVRLPCYDLAPITGFTLGRPLRLRTSGTPGFHGLTGGVYKARERIHRAVADARLSSPPSSHLTMAVRPESPAPPDGNWPKGLRSLWHLSRHLTARADDNHAAPPCLPLLAPEFPLDSGTVQARVRFLAYHRIKPHVPPLVRAPVNSFEFLSRRPYVADSECPSFTVRTTRVSNPV